MLRISFTRLSIKALNDLAASVLEAILPVLETLLNNNVLVAVLKKKYAAYNEVVIKNRTVKLGDYVLEKDIFRDKMFRALRSMVKNLAKFTELEKGKAAAAIEKHFDEVGDINGLSYEEQNTVMDALIRRLESPESTALLAAASLTQEFDAMKQSQIDFKTLAAEQTAGNALLSETPYASHIRSELEDALRNIFALVSSMRKQPEWSSLYAHMAQLIKEAEDYRDFSPKKEPEK